MNGKYFIDWAMCSVLVLMGASPLFYIPSQQCQLLPLQPYISKDDSKKKKNKKEYKYEIVNIRSLLKPY